MVQLKKLFPILVFLFTGTLSAQISGNILYNETNRWKVQNQVILNKAAFSNPNEVLFEVNSMFNVEADSYLAIFHISQVGSTAREADSLMNNRISAFKRDALQRNIKDEDFVIDMLSMVPVYDIEVTKKLFSKSYTEIPAGFEIQKNIHIHFDNAQVLDEIITAAAINEIYDLIKVDYYVKDVEAIYDTLRAKAVDWIEKKTEQYEKLGIPLEGQWRVASDRIGVFFPLDRYESYQAFSNISVEATKKRGSVTQMKKPKTVYYNKIPYTNYDIIINPEIIEPAVQYTYNLQVKFTLEKPEKKKNEPIVKVEKEIKYVLITENGQLKELPLK